MRLFGRIIAERLQEDEDIADVLVGSSRLARRRSDLLGREVLPLDVEYVLAMLCWWPMKPEVSDQVVKALRQFRGPLFSGVAADPAMDRLDEIPDAALTLSIEELYELQRSGGWLYSASEVEAENLFQEEEQA